ncbi:MAG: long-chain fatty acid--CoA ligase [Moorea sp. SIOASIH]|uniref:class I adenylate-forming enzyme family protein n=1 Tax=Moorena sp. SIOASIH TaxID=2607817 RepID=UPI0013B641B8|nr:fatty acid--CoA ligase family protein [Moorena sp. SIOASIH]NEO42586.1 long-chain fatty acid--CoA ligase [Moorena sp. SIOASIH]
MLESLPSSTKAQKNVLTDGQLTCTYQELPEVFEALQQYFDQRGISITDCFALECDNTVSSALVLLYLLERGYRFLLLPQEVNPPQVLGSKQSLPRFCRYKIRTGSFTDKPKAPNFRYPEQFVDIVENEDWIGDGPSATAECDRIGINPIQENNPSRKLYIRTSGSTGKPKIAVHSHDKLLRNALNCLQRLGLKQDDRIAIPVPIYHMYGLGAAFLPGVMAGASIDLQKNSNLLKYMQRERDFNPNVAFMTPMFCETLLKGRKTSRKYNLTVVAGDRIREDTFVRFESRFGSLVSLYGSTEMGAMAASSPDQPQEVRLKTVGKPMSGVKITLAKDNTDGVSELWCHHDYGFEGYVDQDGKPISQGIQTQTDWFGTKDLGRIWSDGHLEVIGRCDYSVNRNGLLVLLADVERGIETIEGIDSVVVVSQGESQRGKGIVAYCVLAKDSNIPEPDIRAACFDILPRHGIPDQIFLVNSFPKLPNGKVDRLKLIGMHDQGKGKHMRYAHAARTAVSGQP